MSVQSATPRSGPSIASSAAAPSAVFPFPFPFPVPVPADGAGHGDGLCRADGTDRGGAPVAGCCPHHRAGPPVLRESVLSAVMGAGLVGRALERAGHAEVRRQVLTGEVTALVVLGGCLYSGEGYDSVLARVVPAAAVRAPGAKVPTSSALCQARARLGEAPMRALFELTAASPLAPGQTAPDGDVPDGDVPGGEAPGRAVPGHAGPAQAGARAFGLEVVAVDGTVWDLAASPAIGAGHPTPRGGRHPQARMVAMVSCTTRKVRGAAVDSACVGEQRLLDGLARQAGPGMLVLADRGFFSMARWLAFAATGAHLAWRVRNGARSLPVKVVAELADGSRLVRLRESRSMLCRRRGQAGDGSLPALPPVLARLVEFDVLVADGRGRRRGSRVRVLTTLLDARACPAVQIAAVYARRWQIEVVYRRIKVSLRGGGALVRARTPQLARQEIWAFLALYNALCDLAVAAAARQGADPDEVCFAAVVRLVRAVVAVAGAGPGHGGWGWGCVTSGEAVVAGLVGMIAAYPRNRLGRGRAGPRRGRYRPGSSVKVTYSIMVTTSNLPKEA